MAVGQQVLSGVASLERLRAAEDGLSSVVADEGAVHVRKLQCVLALHREHEADGRALSALPEAARFLRCSEWRANRLLDEALFLSALPGALDAIRSGLLTVEQSAVVVTQLRQVADLPRRLSLWAGLLEKLARPEGAALPPSRLRELLQRWIAQSDPTDAERRRKAAEEERRVEYRRRDDGLVDVLLLGIAAPIAQAVLQRIRDAARPVGLFDDRRADQRRLDAAVDLLLGRIGSSCAAASGPGAWCGCRPGTPVPCGADVKVLVPLGAALGTTDEVATLAGHGPLEPDLLQALLRNAPRLRPVFVDENGVPVSLGPRQATPPRDDEQALREALLHLAGSPPGRFHPRHPGDHPAGPDASRPPDDATPPGGASRPLGYAAPPERASAEPTAPEPTASPDRHDPAYPTPCRATESSPALGRPHPPDAPGPYAVTGLLRELIFLRAPLCEFPGCGVKAEACDAEHDRAHPDGPTCACNLGPCCRHHHRMKQQGWTKTRQADSGVLWTSPTGRSWLNPSQHQPPAPPVRPLPALPTPDPLDELSPNFADDELWLLLDRPDDPQAWELRATDLDPDEIDPDPTGTDTRWTLDLTDPYAWLNEPALA